MNLCLEAPNSSYCPGLWSQDLYTLPIEGALIAGMSRTTLLTSHPSWPFRHEHPTLKRHPTRHPAALLLPIGTSIVGGTLAFTTLSNENINLAVVTRGWLHAHLVTELATLWAKSTFQRKRPFYDSPGYKNKKKANDDRFSFFSGHSSHAFAFATYGSYLVRAAAPSTVGSWIYTGLLYTGATAVASARAIDHQHHWSDVGVGALAGTAISWFIAHRALSLATAPTILVSEYSRWQFDLLGTPGVQGSLSASLRIEW